MQRQLVSSSANGVDQRADQCVFGKGLFQAPDVSKIGRYLAAIISGRKNERQAFRLKDARQVKCVPVAQVDIHDGDVDGVGCDQLVGFRQIVGGTDNGSSEVGYAGNNAVALDMVILGHQDVEPIKSSFIGFIKHNGPAPHRREPRVGRMSRTRPNLD